MVDYKLAELAVYKLAERVKSVRPTARTRACAQPRFTRYRAGAPTCPPYRGVSHGLSGERAHARPCACACGRGAHAYAHTCTIAAMCIYRCAMLAPCTIATKRSYTRMNNVCHHLRAHRRAFPRTRTCGGSYAHGSAWTGSGASARTCACSRARRSRIWFVRASHMHL